MDENRSKSALRETCDPIGQAEGKARAAVGGPRENRAGHGQHVSAIAESPSSKPTPADLIERGSSAGEREAMLLHMESVAVTKQVRRSLVRAIRRTKTREVAVEKDLLRDQVVVERVAVGRAVDTAPAVRHVGDLTILPVMAEEIVVVRRLILKEEVRIRHVRMRERHTETVTLRKQHVTVTRAELAG